MRLVLFAAVLAVLSALTSLPVSAAPVPVPERGTASADEWPPDPGEKKPLDFLVNFTDVEAYKFLVLSARVPQRGSADYKPESWRDTAIGNIVAWTEFIERYPKSPLVSHAYLRMAEWYLTIKKGDDRPDWYEGEEKKDPNEIKDNPGVLDPVYVTEGLKLLNRVIARFPNDPYFGHVGDGEFAWNDKVGAVALYLRGLFFRGSCKQDLARLRRNYPDSPSTRDAAAHFAKACLR